MHTHTQTRTISQLLSARSLPLSLPPSLAPSFLPNTTHLPLPLTIPHTSRSYSLSIATFLSLSRSLSPSPLPLTLSSTLPSFSFSPYDWVPAFLPIWDLLICHPLIFVFPVFIWGVLLSWHQWHICYTTFHKYHKMVWWISRRDRSAFSPGMLLLSYSVKILKNLPATFFQSSDSSQSHTHAIPWFHDLGFVFTRLYLQSHILFVHICNWQCVK